MGVVQSRQFVHSLRTNKKNVRPQVIQQVCTQEYAFAFRLYVDGIPNVDFRDDGDPSNPFRGSITRSSAQPTSEHHGLVRDQDPLPQG